MKSPVGLVNHPFVAKVWGDGNEVIREVANNETLTADGSQNEYQFYVTRIGHSLGNLVAWIEQLEHAILYMADFNYGGPARKSGVTRADHLVYHVENYLIRLQSAYDRALHLVNNVFHLCLEDNEVKRSVVISNLHVARTDVPALLKVVEKSIKSKAQKRHELIHRHSIQDENLHRLRQLYVWDEDNWQSAKGVTFDAFASFRAQRLKGVIGETRAEFTAINIELTRCLGALLSGLEKHYDSRARRLHMYMYDVATPAERKRAAEPYNGTTSDLG